VTAKTICDNATDSLTGGSGFDWFLDSTGDKLTGVRASSSTVTPIP
jgi:hypothetical protein